MKPKNLLALLAVAIFAAAFASAASVTVKWQDNSTTEKGFYVERAPGTATATDGTFTRVATIEANGTTFVDTAVEPGKSYSYRVQAFDGVQLSAYSNIAVATLAPPLSAPGTTTAEQTQLVVVTIPSGGSLLVNASPTPQK